MQSWKTDLESKKRSKIAVALADPSEDSELFENWEAALTEENEKNAPLAIANGHTNNTNSKQMENATNMVKNLHIGSREVEKDEEDDDEMEKDAVMVDAEEEDSTVNGKASPAKPPTSDLAGDVENEAILA